MIPPPSCWNRLRRNDGKRTKGEICGFRMRAVVSSGGQVIGWRCARCAFTAGLQRRGAPFSVLEGGKR